MERQDYAAGGRPPEDVMTPAGAVSGSSERLVVAAAKTGCADCFAELVDRYQARIFHYFTRRTGDGELAADLTQQTFLDAFRRLDRLDDKRPFVAWLYRIAHYNLLYERRRQRSRHSLSLDQLVAQSGSANRALHQPDRVETVHEQALIQHALDRLTPSLREPLMLQTVGGYTSQEVANVLDISWDAARQRIARAKEQFRRTYQGAYEAEAAGQQ